MDAVNCAVDVQDRLADDSTIKLRIGIHIGDIVHEDEDIFGDGVNIAARLQEIAAAGGIAVSDIARRSLDGTLADLFEPLGERILKNIAEPVPVFHRGDGLAVPEEPGEQLVLPDKPSIAVLPFDNLSGDPAQDYFADGVVESLTAALSRIGLFFVVARNAAFTFKGKSATFGEIRRRLGVRYYLEGSVQKAGERVRITVQVIETEAGKHIWADQYDGTLADVFDLQDQIVEKVAGAIQPSVQKAEIERARRKRPQDLDAYDLTMQAMPHVWSLDQAANTKALDLLSRALEKDGEYPLALSLAAWCHGQRAVYNWAADIEDEKTRALALAQQAVDLSHDDPLTLAILGAAHSIASDHGAAGVLLERAVAIDPNSAWAWNRLGWQRSYVDRPEEAIESFERALRLSPHDPMNFNCYIGIGTAHDLAGRPADAVTAFERGLRERPQAIWLYRILIASYVTAGRMEDARRGVRILLEHYPDLTVAKVKQAFVFSDQAMERIGDRLHQAGLPLE